MSPKHEKIFRLVSERTGTPYEDIVEAYSKLSHEKKRQTIHDLKFALKRPRIGGEVVENTSQQYFPVK